MKEKRKILWIEDGARYDLPQLAAPVHMHGGYELVVAEDASEGLDNLLQGGFDVIIVDIRLPPGHDPRLVDLFKKAGSDKVAARLGLHLLFAVLGSPRAELALEERPAWITPERIGFLTVESLQEIAPDLEELRIEPSHFRQKDARASETVLLDLIEHILAHAG